MMRFSLYAMYIRIDTLLRCRDAASLLPASAVCFLFSEDSFLGFSSCLLKTKRSQGEVRALRLFCFPWTRTRDNNCRQTER
ncbi:hypothetical protein Xszus_00795 [Xenorhabdus szentirmaii]|nr:hypothetical protein Xsze_03321 [Xenorhabdus szentirmaii DSM 16338]PHM41118.1 hypothetical protein Xszus_00795 [Xenorhabdus szentirmaii]